jgi:hypothetical protein
MRILLLVALIFSMLMLPLLSAETSSIPSLDEVQQGYNVSLHQGGSNGTASWEYCNISNIYNPQHNKLVSDISMTKNGFSFNYTLSGVYTQTLGIYVVEGYCGDGYNIEPFAYKFPVTTTGGDSSISLWISLILLFVAILFLILALILDNQYLGFICGSAFLIDGIYIMAYGFGSMSDMYTRAIGMISLGFGILVMLVSAFSNYEDPEGNGFKKLIGLDEEPEEKDGSDYYNE